MTSLSRRVVILPTSLEYDRVEKIFDEIAPDKVYILYNDDPIGMHEEVNEEVRERARDIVERRTVCHERGEVEEVGINFYQFNRSLVDVYEIIYRESKRNNEVFVNISGGTKPVAIALTYACSLTEIGQPLYFPAGDYEEVNGRVASSSVIETAFEVDPLKLLDITDVLPTDDEKQTLVLNLLPDNTMGVTELLASADIIASDPPDDEEKKNERQRLTQKYHRHANKLVDERILVKSDGEYRLTDSGELVARLIQVRNRIDGDSDS